MFEFAPSPPPFWDQVADRWDALLTDGRSFPNYEEAFRRFHWFMKRVLRVGNRSKSYRLLDRLATLEIHGLRHLLRPLPRHA
jgi:hypothetical protein